jgi:hypothetical protein
LRFYRVLESQAGGADDCRFPWRPERTRRVHHDPPRSIQNKLLIAISESA